jgi:ketosteroid isomerase-like protein
MRSLLLPVALVAAAPAAAQDVSAATLLEIADRFDAAQIAQDAKSLDALTASDLVFIDGDGKHLGKREFVAGWLDPSVRFEPIEITGRYLQPLGPDAGVAGGEVVLRGTANGRRFASHIRFADTFRRIDGRWQAVHIQVTRIPAN